MRPERYITLREAAALSGLSYSHLALLARTGKLQVWRIGSLWLTTSEAVSEYANNPEKRSHDPLKYHRTGKFTRKLLDFHARPGSTVEEPTVEGPAPGLARKVAEREVTFELRTEKVEGHDGRDADDQGHGACD